MSLFTEWAPKKHFCDRGDGHLPFNAIRRRYRWDRKEQKWELILPYVSWYLLPNPPVDPMFWELSEAVRWPA